MPKEDVLEMCEKAIRKQLGTLDDLPRELANTVANVYYRFFDQCSAIEGSPGNLGWIPPGSKKNADGFVSHRGHKPHFRGYFYYGPTYTNGYYDRWGYWHPYAGGYYDRWGNFHPYRY